MHHDPQQPIPLSCVGSSSAVLGVLLRGVVSVALLVVALGAQTITGRLVDPGGVPIPNITVDAGSGVPGLSDALGNFVVGGLAAGTYDVEYLPVQGAPWAARSLETVVNPSASVGDIVLQPGFDIVGVATDANGAPLMSCNLNVYAPDGSKLFTPYDNTDIGGNFAVTVPAGTWEVRVQPPVGAQLIATTLNDVVTGAPGNANVGVVVLRTGYPCTGAVVDAVSGLPIGGVKLKAYDAITHERLVLKPNDQTNVFGQFNFLLPYGLVDLRVEPASGDSHVGREVFGRAILGATALGSIALENGALLSGTVLANGSPVLDADIDVFDGPVKLFVAHDHTDASGQFSIAVPLGRTLDVRVEPTHSTGLVGERVAGVLVVGPTSIGAVALSAGVLVSGNVSGPAGGEAHARVRCFDGLGEEVVLVGNETDAAGDYQTWVPLGTFDFVAQPVDGSVSQDGSQQVAVAGATTVDFVLQSKLFRTRVSSYGTPTVPQGLPLPINVLLHSMVQGWQTVRIDLLVEPPAGAPIPLLVGLPLTLPPVAFTVGPLFVPLPPLPPALLGLPLDMTVRVRDAAGVNVLDDSGTTFYVQ